MQIVIDIPYTQEMWENAKEYGHIDIDGVEIGKRILDGVPLSEIKDRWKTGYEKLYQDKMEELNRRKKELETKFNISVQDAVIEMAKCCNESN